MQNSQKHIVTAALPYANGPLHIGHIAGAYLPADIYFRYLKIKGKDAVFVCGSDEHGAAITLRAKKDETTPKAIVDKYHQLNKDTFKNFGINFSIYHRTSEAIHHKTAQDFFTILNNKKELEIQTGEQFYDEKNNQFLADRYITGICPKCNSENAYGDQCEKCGSTLSPTELINPKSTLSGNTPIMKSTSHWYLPMQRHEKWLKEWINTGVLDGKQQHDPKTWKNQVVGQCNSWIDGGLQARAMTRDLDWGVKVPLQNADGKVLYVWMDAPLGYISATKQWAADNNKKWEDYWQNRNTNLTCFIGKDNIVFHCIIFPILLKTYGGYILPKNVPANEFLNLEGNKLSTSRNWAVWLHEYLEDFPNKQDELRYVLTAIAPENKDSEFTWKDYQARVNNELVAILGNFVNRALVLTQKYYNGVVPHGTPDEPILQQVIEQYNKVDVLIENHNYRSALAEVMQVARMGNKYMADTEPWKLIKTDEQKTADIILTSLKIVAHLTEILKPFLPHTSTKLLAFLNSNKGAEWGGKDALKSGQQLNKAELLFQKIEDNEIDAQVAKLKQKSNENITIPTHKPMKDTINFDDFTKMDIRVGIVLEAEKVEKTDQLLKLKVDTGLDIRTVVSGIAKAYNAEDIVGQEVSILMNLAPRKIKGIESQGMILMAENKEGDLSFVAPTKKEFAASEIG